MSSRLSRFTFHVLPFEALHPFLKELPFTSHALLVGGDFYDSAGDRRVEAVLLLNDRVDIPPQEDAHKALCVRAQPANYRQVPGDGQLRRYEPGIVHGISALTKLGKVEGVGVVRVGNAEAGAPLFHLLAKL